MAAFRPVSSMKCVLYGFILVSIGGLTSDFPILVQAVHAPNQPIEAALTPNAGTSSRSVTTPLSPRDDIVTQVSARGGRIETIRSVVPSLSSLKSVLMGPSGRKIRLSVPVATGIGVVLAFNSGYLNGCCLSGLLLPSEGIRQGTAAVTGAFTTSALAFAHSPKDGLMFPSHAVRSQLSVILSYFGGSCLAGLLNPNPVPFYVSSSTAPTLVMGALLLYKAISHCGVKELAVSSCTKNPWIVFCLVAAVNGLQNSLTSVHTANLVRSAHFSGSASDTGTFVGQLLRGNGQNRHRIAINTALMLAFWTGGAVAFSCVQAWSVSSLVWSARLYLTMAAIVLGLQFL